MRKLTFDEALQRIGDERHVTRGEVQSRALQRKVWIAEWHIPGCLSESFSVCLTKAEAIESALGFANVGECGEPPRGMASALRKYGRFDSRSPLYGTCVNTISCAVLADLC